MKRKYRAMNRHEGLTDKALSIGDFVTLEEEKAAPYVASGSLELVEDAKREPVEESKKDPEKRDAQ